MHNTYTLDVTGIYRPSVPVQHRDEEYNQSGFETLFKMQEKHFWYRGRHKFLLAAVDRYTAHLTGPLSAVDLGGGVGGWVRYLADRRTGRYDKIALADSSETALKLAKGILPEYTNRYQIDLMNLGWENQWDTMFMLDVIEHLPDDTEAVRQAAKALKPGGYLFITAPALQQFWSYNDEFARHLRRYKRSDYGDLAQSAGLVLCDARYFMFFLSPLYLISRMKPGIDRLTEAEKNALIERQHQTPSMPVNTVLSLLFGAETLVGHRLSFPWGTSILGVFRKP